MSNLSQMFEDFGFDQIGDHTGDLFDYHPTGGSEVEAITGIVEARNTATEIEQARYENAVEVLTVAFKNDADDGIVTPARKDYITDAGESVKYFYNATIAENGTWRTMVFVRHSEIRSGYQVGNERGYR